MDILILANVQNGRSIVGGNKYPPGASAMQPFSVKSIPFAPVTVIPDTPLLQDPDRYPAKTG
jgi:hypothetical protein